MSTEANLVFNNNLRVMAQDYFARANAALHFSDFWAVRVTSGAKSETLYPQGGKYWAFDVNAQNGPNLPASMAAQPVPRLEARHRRPHRPADDPVGELVRRCAGRHRPLAGQRRP